MSTRHGRRRLLAPLLGRPGLQRELAGHFVDERLAGQLGRREFVRRSTVIGLGAASAGWLLAACGDDDDAATETDPTTGLSGSTVASTTATAVGGRLRVGAPAPVGPVDPILSPDTGAKSVWNLVTEYLLWVENDATLRPVLAESWEPSDEGRAWTFALRPGVTFHDGAPLTAADVVATFQRLSDPAGQSAALSQFATILSPDGVVEAGDLSVRFELDRPFSDFPYLVGSINHNAAVLKAEGGDDFAAAPIGTGPFRLDRLDTSGASFSAYDRYWEPGYPLLEGVDLTFYEDPQAADLALQGGDTDMSVLAPPPGSPLYVDAGFEVSEAPSSQSTFLNLRIDDGPLADVRVRQAVALCLDRDRLVETLFAGRAVPGNDHMFAPAFASAPTNIDQRAQDYGAARRLLEEADLADGFAITLTTHDVIVNAPLAEQVQAMCREVGIDVTLDVVPSEAFYGGEPPPWLSVPMGIVEWGARGVPGQFITPTVTCDGVWNSSAACDPAFDQLLRDYDAALEPAQQAQLAEQLAALQHEQVWTVIPFWQSQVRVFRQNVAHVVTSSAPLDLRDTAIAT